MSRKTRSLALVSILAAFVSVSVSAQTYFPGRHDWQKRAPEEMGMSSARLKEAIDFAIASESDAPKDLALAHELSAFAREPFGQRIGPTTVRAPLNGLVVRGGYIVAEWGETSKVDMTFSNEGATVFADVTGKMADTEDVTGETQRLAIVLDGNVESAPTVHDRIEGGRAEITGKFTVDEARSLALVLQTGSLPIELEPVSQNAIGATLGKAALNQALIAGAIGLLLIIVFMIAYYRLLGLVASIALIIYGVLFLGILNGIGVTMTLPGIAGMILTLGMAVDANVLIFARMRDEVANGKTIGPATNAGFKKAFRAVFDCNMTTILTAVILFWAASGGIKGFALTLGVGVALSMFTAVVVTRSMLTLLSGWRVFRYPKALGLHVPRRKTVAMEKGGRA